MLRGEKKKKKKEATAIHTDSNTHLQMPCTMPKADSAQRELENKGEIMESSQLA